MVGYLAVDSGVQPPLLVQILPTVVGGTLALAAAIYVAVRNSRAEHRRWLRQERLKAYSTFLESANRGLDTINAMLRRNERDYAAILLRSTQISDDLQRHIGGIVLLGPATVTVAAEAVLSSFVRSADSRLNAISDANSEEEILRALEMPTGFQDPSLALLGWINRASKAFDGFKRLAANEIQGHQAATRSASGGV
jgi:hypothetical protein